MARNVITESPSLESHPFIVFSLPSKIVCAQERVLIASLSLFLSSLLLLGKSLLDIVSILFAEATSGSRFEALTIRALLKFSSHRCARLHLFHFAALSVPLCVIGNRLRRLVLALKNLGVRYLFPHVCVSIVSSNVPAELPYEVSGTFCLDAEMKNA